MIQVLRDYNSLVLLIDQISEEFCIENIVSLIEFMQFIDFIKENYNSNENFSFYINFKKGIPESLIISKTRNESIKTLTNCQMKNNDVVINDT